MKFLNWVVNHLRLCVAIIVFPIALAVCGIVMYNSKVEYDEYVEKYDNDVLTTKATSAIDPLEVLVNNSFTSKRASKYTASANDFVLPTGKEVTNNIIEGLTDAKYEVTLKANFEAMSYCDVALELASGYEKDSKPAVTEDLLAVVSIKINGTEVAGDIKLGLDDDGEVEWTTMVIRGIALDKGESIISISQLSDAEKGYMPKIKSATVYADVKVTF